MPIQRLPGSPHTVTPTARNQVLYSVELNVVPSPPWRAAFLRLPARLISAQYTPELGRLGLPTGRRCTPGRPRIGRASGCAGSTAGSLMPTRWWRRDERVSAGLEPPSS
jgi:hypothetical protein